MYIRLGMFFYFKKLKVKGRYNVSKDQPILLLANHQNALLDALLIAITCGRFVYFLTRASVFKKALVSKLLKSLHMLPVYRVRDGWHTISNNNAVFDTCKSLLNKNEAVVIFPEGSHNLARRVRPLSKGFTRIVFDTLELTPELPLQLIPVGVNFQNAIAYPDRTAIYYGAPITARDFISENRNEGVIKLKSTIHAELSKLTTHIDETNYEDTIMKLNALQPDYLHPQSVNAALANDLQSEISKYKPMFKLLQQFFKGVMLVNILLPYLVWKLFVQPKIKELEFTATFRFAIAITLVPIYLLVVTVLLTVFLDLKLALIYLVSVIIVSLLSTKL
jgi:1-acyl-sn-glycerol-3-phosphate acyltransferase